jgi:hypothetical protein
MNNPPPNDNNPPIQPTTPNNNNTPQQPPPPDEKKLSTTKIIFIVLIVLVVIAGIVVALYFTVFKKEEVTCTEGQFLWSDNTCHECLESISENGACPACSETQIKRQNGSCGTDCIDSGNTQELDTTTNECQCKFGFNYYDSINDICLLCKEGEYYNFDKSCSVSTCKNLGSTSYEDENGVNICECKEGLTLVEYTCLCPDNKSPTDYYYSLKQGEAEQCHTCQKNQSVDFHNNCVNLITGCPSFSQPYLITTDGKTDYKCVCNSGYQLENNQCINTSQLNYSQIKVASKPYCLDSGSNNVKIYDCTTPTSSFTNQSFTIVCNIRTLYKNQRNLSEYTYAFNATYEVDRYYTADSKITGTRDYWLFVPVVGEANNYYIRSRVYDYYIHYSSADGTLICRPDNQTYPKTKFNYDKNYKSLRIYAYNKYLDFSDQSDNMVSVSEYDATRYKDFQIIFIDNRDFVFSISAYSTNSSKCLIATGNNSQDFTTASFGECYPNDENQSLKYNTNKQICLSAFSDTATACVTVQNNTYQNDQPVGFQGNLASTSSKASQQFDLDY